MKNIRRYVSIWEYVRLLLILASTVTGCVSISVFGSLVRLPVCITNFALGLKISEFTA